MSLVYSEILTARESNQKLLFILIDPDKWSHSYLKELFNPVFKNRFHAILIGGSVLLSGDTTSCIIAVRTYSDKPIILFPGNPSQFSDSADALLLLSLISGRNPDYLIGHHVSAANRISESGIEVIPTAYIIIGEHTHSSVLQVTQTEPIPSEHIELLAKTVLAGEQLGLRLTYLEQGSGAHKPPDPNLIRRLRPKISGPLAVGGGIQNGTTVQQLWDAGADIVVVGTALEIDVHTFFKS